MILVNDRQSPVSARLDGQCFQVGERISSSKTSLCAINCWLYAQGGLAGGSSSREGVGSDGDSDPSCGVEEWRHAFVYRASQRPRG